MNNIDNDKLISKNCLSTRNGRLDCFNKNHVLPFYAGKGKGGVYVCVSTV